MELNTAIAVARKVLASVLICIALYEKFVLKDDRKVTNTLCWAILASL